MPSRKHPDALSRKVLHFLGIEAISINKDTMSTHQPDRSGDVTPMGIWRCAMEFAEAGPSAPASLSS